MSRPWVFMTGITRGVGKCTAIKLAECGCNVIGLSRSCPEYISEYSNIRWFSFDLSNSFDKKIVVSSVRKHTDVIDVIILNAAQAYYGKIVDLPDTYLEKMLNTNLVSSIHILQNLLPMMKKNGQVIFIGSSAEYIPAPNMGMYAALKAAQSHLAMTLNVEHVHKKLQFKVLKPGFINTSFAERSGVPLGTLNAKLAMSPDKVADDILLLMRKKVLVLNSGWVSKLLHVLNKISIKICMGLSIKRHGDNV